MPRTDPPDPRSALLDAIEEYAALLDEAERELRTAVATARAAGASWADVAARLGVSRQAAWERFATDRGAVKGGRQAGTADP